jgi:hypothetical protein
MDCTPATFPLLPMVAWEFAVSVTLAPLDVVTVAGALVVVTVLPGRTGNVGTDEGALIPLIFTGCLLVTVATRDCASANPAAAKTTTEAVSRLVLTAKLHAFLVHSMISLQPSQ